MAIRTGVERHLQEAVKRLLEDAAFSEIEPVRRAMLVEDFTWRWAYQHRQKTETKPKHGGTWTDAQLSSILNQPGTYRNIVILAQAFERGVGSIHQIYRWAQVSEKEARRKRGDNSFIMKIRKVVKDIGLA